MLVALCHENPGQQARPMLAQESAYFFGRIMFKQMTLHLGLNPLQYGLLIDLSRWHVFKLVALRDNGTASVNFNLDSSVERARVGACRVDWQGATTRVVVPRKDKQGLGRSLFAA
jgi:hypothetical protein